ncbi:MAG: YceI family protein [Proteobacteria bacterium]|nr:YceI family protein [Pseudomonadota bacterium]
MLLALALALAPAAQAAPTTYTVKPADGRLYVVVKYVRGTAIRGHDHVVGASKYTGTITWDPEDLSACNVAYALKVEDLAVDPGDARTWEHLHGETPEKDKPKIKANFMGKYQLQADQFPEISFQSQSCTQNGDRVDVTGAMTMHGVSHTVTVPMKIDATPDSFTAQGSTELLLTDYGMDPFTALLGALKNENALKLVIETRATP